MAVSDSQPVSAGNLRAALEAAGGVSRDTLFTGGSSNNTSYSQDLIGELGDFSELVIGLKNTYGRFVAVTVPATPCTNKSISGQSMTSNSGTLSGTLTIVQYDGYFNIRVETSAPTFVCQIIGVR